MPAKLILFLIICFVNICLPKPNTVIIFAPPIQLRCLSLFKSKFAFLYSINTITTLWWREFHCFALNFLMRVLEPQTKPPCEATKRFWIDNTNTLWQSHTMENILNGFWKLYFIILHAIQSYCTLRFFYGTDWICNHFHLTALIRQGEQMFKSEVMNVQATWMCDGVFVSLCVCCMYNKTETGRDGVQIVRKIVTETCSSTQKRTENKQQQQITKRWAMSHPNFWEFLFTLKR